MRRWRNGKKRRLRRQASEFRRRLGEPAHPGRNGHRRGHVRQDLELRARAAARTLRRRSLLLLVCSVVFAAVVGSRACSPIYHLTDEQRERNRADILTMCEINNCSAAKLAGLLQQLDAMPRAEEEKRE